MNEESMVQRIYKELSDNKRIFRDLTYFLLLVEAEKILLRSQNTPEVHKK